GLGTAICKKLAEEGRQVIAADLGSRQDRLEAFREETRQYNGSIVFAPADVANFEDCANLVNHVTGKYGSVDIVFNMCRNTVDGMTERGFGRIVNISSVNGQTGQFGQTNYSAAKAGMHGFTM